MSGRRLEAVARIPSVNQPARGIFSPMFPRPECHADVHIKSGHVTIGRDTHFCQSISSPHFPLEQLGHTSCDKSVTGIDRLKCSNCRHTDSWSAQRKPASRAPFAGMPSARGGQRHKLLEGTRSISACSPRVSGRRHAVPTSPAPGKIFCAGGIAECDPIFICPGCFK